MPHHRVDKRHAEIRGTLEELGALVVDTNTLGGGVPDLAVIYDGRTTWLEIKTAGQEKRKGKTAERQYRFQLQAAKLGVTVHRIETPEEAVALVFTQETVMTIKLGDRVRDTISGFEGICTGRSVYLNGCVHVWVAPTELDKDGDMRKAQWIDEPQLEIVKKEKKKAAKPTGGPSPGGGGHSR